MIIRWNIRLINKMFSKFLSSLALSFFFFIVPIGGPALGATVRVEGSIPLKKPVSEITIDIIVSSIEQKDQASDYKDLSSYLDVLVKGNVVALNEADAQKSNNKYLATYESSNQDPNPNNFTVTIKVKLRKLSGTIDDDLENNNLRVKAKYKKDSESPETLIARTNLVFNAAPSFLSEQPIIGSHKQLLINVSPVNTVPTSSGQEKTPSTLYVYAFKAEEGVEQEYTLPARIFEANNDNPRLVSCTLKKPNSNRGECLTSCVDQNEAKTNVYLDHTEIANKNLPNFYVNRISISPNSNIAVTLGGLENQKKYFVFLTYDQGTKSSECLVGEPSINYTLTELNGEKEASVVDLRCFIASAAYGSPLAKEVEVFRWYRDKILKQSSFGRLAIEVYYFMSPFLAEMVHQNVYFRQWSRSTLDRLSQIIKARMQLTETPDKASQVRILHAN